LNIILSNKKNEEIQEELLDLVGFQNLELLEQLLDKRELIKEITKIIMKITTILELQLLEKSFQANFKILFILENIYLL